MEMCKVSILRLKVLNKHNAHNVHRDGECYPQFNKSQDIMYTSTKVEA